ncbi:MAG: hypothetical protein E7618_08285 [Ruminococcaceae bacterium]|nr:hypothetical protein [Oscillospiraceae bacterium]
MTRSVRKIKKMNEWAWVFGVLLCSLGVALCTKAGFGLSMIAAPAYVLHVKLSTVSSFFTQGACEYLWQGLLLVLMCLGIQRFRYRYLFAFVTAILSGLAIDGWLFVLGGSSVPASLLMRIVFFVLGELITSLAVALYFRTTWPLQIYELLVAEISDRFAFPIGRVKLINDMAMLTISVALALGLNHSLDGIGIGTVIIALVNAFLIGLFGRLLDRFFTFETRTPRLTAFLAGKS